MTTLCFLDDAHRRYSQVHEENTVCGRTITGLTRGTIPLNSNATRDRTLVSCAACLAAVVDKALKKP